MASLGFTRSDVQALLSVAESSRESGETKEGDYLRYCNALKYLHDHMPAVEAPPLQRSPAGPYQVDERLRQLRSAYSTLQRQLQTTRPRLTDRHKVKVVVEILTRQGTALPPENPTRRPRAFLALALPLVDVSENELKHLFYRERERDHIIECDRIRATMSRIQDSILGFS